MDSFWKSKHDIDAYLLRIRSCIESICHTSEEDWQKFSINLEYRKYKNIPDKSKLNFRDNMTDLELIFTMLGEKVTTEISQQEKTKTFDKNKDVAKRGGKVAGNARKETEKELGRSVISKQNFLTHDKSKKIEKKGKR